MKRPVERRREGETERNRERDRQRHREREDNSSEARYMTIKEKGKQRKMGLSERQKM